MNAKQLDAALGLSIGQAVKSIGKEIDPAQILGLLEMHKAAVCNLLFSAPPQPQIVPAAQMPRIVEP